MTLRRQGLAALGCALAAVALTGCGEAAVGGGAGAGAHSTRRVGAGRPAADPAPSAAVEPAVASRSQRAAREVADPLEAESYPVAATVKHASAATPSKAGAAIVAAGAPSNAEIRSELAQMRAVEHSSEQTHALDMKPVPGGESVSGSGAIPIPPNVPEVVQKVIAGANEIADFPYVYGGGHASFVDNAYDCSGSVSYALAAGGLLSAPETSGELESWGAPGPGRYITVYANAGHTYMYVDGILYDTAGRSGPFASRWQVAPTDNSGYVVRHWPGL
jgi:cell wall-associated NlpC family hydrolase